MRELSNKEMLNIEGGGSITGSMLTAVYKIIDTIDSIGKKIKYKERHRHMDDTFRVIGVL